MSDAKVSPPDPETDIVDIDGLARVLKVSVRTIRSMIYSNSIPYMRVKGSYRFSVTNVTKTLSNNK